MKKIAENLMKLLVILVSLAVFVLITKTQQNWWLPLLFSYNFAIVAGYAIMGPVSAIVFLVLALLADGLGMLRALGAHLSLTPFFLEALMFAAVYFLVKNAGEANTYRLFTAQDELKTLDGEHNILLKEEINLRAAIESNSAKLDKYKKLKDIHDGLVDHTVFSGKIRSILRNIISIFHQEKSIVLFMIKDGKFIKAEATKDDDTLVGEPDQESLYLKNFDEWIIKNNKSIIISDMQKEVRFKADEGNIMRSVIAVPVFVQDKMAGVLRISSDKPGCFNQEDLRFLDLIAEMVGRVLAEETANAK
jgi:hypothetical protein